VQPAQDHRAGIVFDWMANDPTTINKESTNENNTDVELMFAAADVYASEAALENIFPYLRENARVAAFGAKLSSSRLGKILNPFLRMLFNLSFSTTPRPDYEPWRILAKRVEKLDIEEYFFGLMFLTSGSVITKKRQ
jgi:hypothetical protein